MPSASTVDITIIVAVLSGVLSSSVIVALIEWRRMRRVTSADAADKLSSAWDKLTEEQRANYAEIIEALRLRVADQDRRLTDMELARRDRDRMYAELGQRLQSEVKIRMQHEETITALRLELEGKDREIQSLRVRVEELERRITGPLAKE